MIAFSYYLLKVMLCSGILYGYYWLALRNRVFHQWNRYYLLSSLFVSVLLPLVRIPVTLEPAPEQARAVRVLEVVSSSDAYVETLAAAAPSYNLLDLLTASIYAVVCLVLLIGLCRGLLAIRRLVRTNPVFPFDHFHLVDTAEEKAPFSFLNYVFWRREIPIDSDTGQQILRHEIAHVREQHSIDKMIMQIVLVFFWMNPFFWMIRKEMGMIHEFIADRQSVAEGDTAAFAAMILQSAYPGRSFGLSNPFFHSPIQRRIHMLLKTRNTKVSYLTRVMALPLLGLIGLAFTVRTIQASRQASVTTPYLDKTITIVLDAGHGGDDAGVLSASGLNEKDITLAIAQRVKALNTDPNLNLVLLRESDQRIEIRNRVEQSIALQPDAYISLHVNGSPGTAGQQKRGLEVYIPQVDDAKIEQTRYLGSALQQALAGTFPVTSDLKKRDKNRIYVLDAPVDRYPRVLLELGYLTNPSDFALLADKQTIDQIARQILEGLRAYAEQQPQPVPVSGSIRYNIADAQHPLVKETLGAAPDTGIIRTGRSTLSLSSATPWEIENNLLIINGKKTRMYEILNKQVEADSMIYYPANHPLALQRYGTDAREGILVFFNAKVTDKPIDEQQSPEVQIKGSMPGTSDTSIKGVRLPGQSPLYVLDGMVVSRSAERDVLNTLVKPEDIDKIEVLQGLAAVSVYGDDAKDGAVVITSKRHASGGESLPEDLKGKVVLTGIGVNDNTPVFTRVEKAAQFPGGQATMNSWLREQLEYQSSVQANPAKFKGKAGLRFIVNSVGQVTNVSLLNAEGRPYNAALGLLVSALLQKGPYWIPAMQNDQKVRSFVDLEFTY